MYIYMYNHFFVCSEWTLYVCVCVNWHMCMCMYVTARFQTVDQFLTIQPDYKLIGHQSSMHRVRKQVNKPVCAVKKQACAHAGQVSTTGSKVIQLVTFMYGKKV